MRYLRYIKWPLNHVVYNMKHKDHDLYHKHVYVSMYEIIESVRFSGQSGYVWLPCRAVESYFLIIISESFRTLTSIIAYGSIHFLKGIAPCLIYRVVFLVNFASKSC